MLAHQDRKDVGGIGAALGRNEAHDLVVTVVRDKPAARAGVQDGDILLGLASSGVHSNGYSLVRKAVFEYGKLKFDDTVADLGGTTVAEALLRPTRLYARPVRSVLRRYRVKHGRLLPRQAAITLLTPS